MNIFAISSVRAGISSIRIAVVVNLVIFFVVVVLLIKILFSQKSDNLTTPTTAITTASYCRGPIHIKNTFAHKKRYARVEMTKHV